MSGEPYLFTDESEDEPRLALRLRLDNDQSGRRRDVTLVVRIATLQRALEALEAKYGPEPER